jgi:hypothetical protein
MVIVLKNVPYLYDAQVDLLHMRKDRDLQIEHTRSGYGLQYGRPFRKRNFAGKVETSNSLQQ